MATRGRRPKPDPKLQHNVFGGLDELREDEDPAGGTAGRPTRKQTHLGDRIPLIVNTSRLARVFGLSERRMQQLRNEGMPNHARGRWDLETVVPWMLDRVERKAAPEDGTITEAQRRYYLARATNAEMSAARDDGQLVDLGVHLAIVAELVTGMKSEIAAAPVRLFDQPEERSLAERICDAILDRLAERAASLGTVEGSGGPIDEAGAEA